MFEITTLCFYLYLIKIVSETQLSKKVEYNLQINTTEKLFRLLSNEV